MKDEYWKKRFTDTTRNIAFDLKLSRNQIQTLLRLQERDRLIAAEGTIVIDTCDEAYFPATSLERKGLTKHNGDNYEITEAGHLVIKLLEIAFSKNELNKLCHFRKLTITKVETI